MGGIDGFILQKMSMKVSPPTVYFRNVFLCGGERGSLGYLPYRVCGQNH